MGGLAKGWLTHEGRPLIERLVAASRAAIAPEAPALFLIGNTLEYEATHLPRLADDPAGLGPIGGLRALLLEAKRRGCDGAIALAVDLPYVDAALIRRLCVERPGAAALAPREAGRWQPLFARYRPDPVLAAIGRSLSAGRSALQSIFDEIGVGPDRSVELALGGDERQRLRDWDRPSDMDGSVPRERP